MKKGMDTIGPEGRCEEIPNDRRIHVVVVRFHPMLGRMQGVAVNSSCLVPSLLPPPRKRFTELAVSFTRGREST